MANFAGYKMANARKERGWDQKTLAENSGVSRSVVSALESGKTTNPRPVTVTALAEALGVTARDLYKRNSPRRAINRPDALTIRPDALTGWPEPPAALFPTPEPTPTTGRRLTTIAERAHLLEHLPIMWRHLFDGCTAQGFSDGEAMQLVTTAITAGSLG